MNTSLTVWNMAHQQDNWAALKTSELALLTEAVPPPAEFLQAQGMVRVPLEGRRIQEEDRASSYGLLPATAVPTFDFQRRGRPRYEVDHVFASEELLVKARALNEVGSWGQTRCQGLLVLNC